MSHFEYLTGAIRLDGNCPAELRDGLDPFYRGPNDERWDNRDSRVLYHESIHFWQTLASAYLSNIISSDWKRLSDFESTGEVLDSLEEALAFYNRDENPFSPYELSESWARFWDVHTRNPLQVIEEENLDPSGSDAPYVPDSAQRYPGESFDYVMQRGIAQSTYEAPYRWLLETLANASSVKATMSQDERLLRGTTSYLAVLIFPAIVHAAFGSPKPVPVFMECVERLSADEGMVREIMGHKTAEGSINLDWLNSWGFLHGELIYPTLSGLGMPDFTSGLDVIDRGHLGSHPIYANYLKRFALLGEHVKRERSGFNDGVDNINPAYLSNPKYYFALSDLAAQDIWVIFAQPGQPNYRLFLGSSMTPPMVEYNDTALFPGMDWIPGSREDDQLNKRITESWRDGMEALRKRVERFRWAEFAVQSGQPANTYDR